MSNSLDSKSSIFLTRLVVLAPRLLLWHDFVEPSNDNHYVLTHGVVPKQVGSPGGRENLGPTIARYVPLK